MTPLLRLERIECLDRSPETLVSRVPEVGAAELAAGARLVVREGHSAVAVRDGRVSETFGPGSHVLPETAGTSPGVVYFASLRGFVNQKWAALEPIVLRDGELENVELRAFGTYSFRISDPPRFLEVLLSAQSEFTNGAVAELLRRWIVAEVSEFLGTHLHTVLELAKHYAEIAAGIQGQVVERCGRRGVTIADFRVLSLSPPESVQAEIDRRAAARPTDAAARVTRCAGCGSSVASDAAYCPACGARRRSDSASGSAYCSSCGARLPT